MANLENSKESVRSAGAYWASRVEFLYDNPSQAIEFLKISSKYPDTFYGKLSIRILRLNHKINFDLPNVSQDFISWLSSKKGGLRALALLQVEEYWHADRELRKLYSSIPEKFHLDLMSFQAIMVCPPYLIVWLIFKESQTVKNGMGHCIQINF